VHRRVFAYVINGMSAERTDSISVIVCLLPAVLLIHLFFFFALLFAGQFWGQTDTCDWLASLSAFKIYRNMCENFTQTNRHFLIATANKSRANSHSVLIRHERGEVIKIENQCPTHVFHCVAFALFLGLKNQNQLNGCVVK
jgi:hypothetical protein